MKQKSKRKKIITKKKISTRRHYSMKKNKRGSGRKKTKRLPTINEEKEEDGNEINENNLWSFNKRKQMENKHFCNNVNRCIKTILAKIKNDNPNEEIIENEVEISVYLPNNKLTEIRILKDFKEMWDDINEEKLKTLVSRHDFRKETNESNQNYPYTNPYPKLYALKNGYENATKIINEKYKQQSGITHIEQETCCQTCCLQG